jgi:AraC-like DNA-binding protein
MQFPPSIELSGYIRHYLFLHQENREIRRFRLFSDGNTGLVFHSSPNLTLNGQPLPNAFGYGQITRYQDIFCQGPADLFIVVFHPDGFNRLFNIRAGELKDKVIPFSDLIDWDRLKHAIHISTALKEKIDCIDNFFAGFLSTHPPSVNPLITSAISFIQKQKGLVTIDHLASFTGHHPRQLERQFTTAIGLSPKKFCNIIRIHSFLKKLRTRKLNLTQCAYDSGYYDQAHLIREFKQITGLTPSQYLRQVSPLAVNFVQLP